MSVGDQACVAFVESATQLLNVAEWAYATHGTAGLRVDALPPNDAFTVRQLEGVAALIAPFGVQVRMLPVRRRSPLAGPAVSQAVRDLAGATRLVVGDPFSRFVQSLLPIAKARDVVVVDDGTATWHFVSCIDDGVPLARWDVPVERAERRSARATRFYTPGPARRLTMFSCLDDSCPAGAELLRNDYAWSRSWRRPEVVEDRVDLLGVSLVGSGVVRHEDYVRAVARIVRRFGKLRYLPHRRESDALVREIGALPGVTVQRFALPVELALREGPVARHVVTFPSTASHTLPLVLGDLGLRLEMQHVDEAWFTPQTSARRRAFVRRIAESAPLPPVPEAV